MGNADSKTKVTNDITNTTINQNIVNDLNKTLMNVSTDTLIKNASDCSSTVSQNNSCKVGDVTNATNFSLNPQQSNNLGVNFTCVDVNKSTGDMNSSMLQNLVTQMKSLNGTDSAAALNTVADSSASSGSFSANSAKSGTTVNNKVSNNVTNETITNIQNIFEQNLNNNFNSDTVKTCIGKTTQSNIAEAGNISNVENVDVSCVQTNTAEQVQKCEMLSEAINKSVNSTLSELGLTVVSEADTKSTTTSDTTATSSATVTSPITELFDGIAKVLGVSTGLFYIICSVVVVVIIGLLIYFLSGGQASVSTPYGDFSAGIPQQGYSQMSEQEGGYKSSSSTSISLTDSSSSLGIGDSSSSSYFTWTGVPESILLDRSRPRIITKDILLTL